MSANYERRSADGWAPIGTQHVPDAVKELLDPVGTRSVTIHANTDYPTSYRRKKP
jgi:hypothetical protein